MCPVKGSGGKAHTVFDLKGTQATANTQTSPAHLRLRDVLTQHTALCSCYSAFCTILATESQQPPDPMAARRAMLVTAHPDDESMGSGLVSRLQAHGVLVRIVVLTNGDKGTNNVSITPASTPHMIISLPFSKWCQNLDLGCILLGAGGKTRLASRIFQGLCVRFHARFIYNRFFRPSSHASGHAKCRTPRPVGLNKLYFTTLRPRIVFMVPIPRNHLDSHILRMILDIYNLGTLLVLVA